MKRKIKNSIFIMLTGILLLGSAPVSAAEDPVVYNSQIIGDSLNIMVGNVGDVQKFSCQIGNIMCEDASVEDKVMMETYLLLDNSLSIDKKYHDTIRQTVMTLIESISEQETVTIATFDKELHYLVQGSSDIQELKKAAEGVEYMNLDTKVTDVMYSLCKDLERAPFDGLRRIILISDGAEYSSVGYTRQEVSDKLEKLAYPVYTIGCTYRDNTRELEEMFSMSRITGAKSIWLDNEKDAKKIADIINECRNTVKVKAKIPEQLRDGASKGVKLKFQTQEGETTVSTTADMPFAEITEEVSEVKPEEVPEPTPEVKPEEIPEPTPEVKPEEVSEPTPEVKPEEISEPVSASKAELSVEATPEPTVSVEKDKKPEGSENTETEKEKNIDKLEKDESSMVTLIAEALLVILAAVLVLRIRKNKKTEKKQKHSSESEDTVYGDEPTLYRMENGLGGDEPTMYGSLGGDEPTMYGGKANLGGDEPTMYHMEHDKTVADAESETVAEMNMQEYEKTMVLGAEEQTKLENVDSYEEFVTVRFTDINNQARMIESPLFTMLSIGRNAQKSQVVFDYEKSVSSLHCELIRRNGRIYIRDLNSTNGTWVNDMPVLDEMEIYTGVILKFGRLEVLFEVE